ncbi:MAG: GGDEF domain-containing protein [Desulfobacteraceae bacterium]|nr:GGDEF domain-containing protein [Desulfobacteraceae bacterium]
MKKNGLVLVNRLNFWNPFFSPEKRIITLSIGLSSYKEEDDEISFVKRADNALYAAKANGKNMVEVFL